MNEETRLEEEFTATVVSEAVKRMAEEGVTTHLLSAEWYEDSQYFHPGKAATLLAAKGHHIHASGDGGFVVTSACSHTHEREEYSRQTLASYHVDRICLQCGKQTASFDRFGGETAHHRDKISAVHIIPVPVEFIENEGEGSGSGISEEERQSEPQGEQESAPGEGRGGQQQGRETEAEGSGGGGEEKEEAEEGQQQGEDNASGQPPPEAGCSPQPPPDPWQEAFWRHWREGTTPEQSEAALRRVSLMKAGVAGTE